MAVDAFSKMTQGLQADVEKLQSNIPSLLSIEACLNKIYNCILALERVVQDESESAVVVSWLTNSI